MPRLRTHFRFSMLWMFAVTSAIAISLGAYLWGTREKRVVRQLVRGGAHITFSEMDGGSCADVRFRETPLRLDVLAVLVEFNQQTPVIRLSVEKCRFEDSPAQMLACLNDLRHASFPGTPCDETTLGQLKRLPRLKVLNLRDAGLVSRDVHAVNELAGLEGLNVSFNAISLADFTQEMPWLQRLWAAGTDVCGDMHTALACFPELEKLDLSQTQLGDEDTNAVVDLPRLKVLDISDTRVTDVGLRELCAADSLVTLDVSNTRVTEEGVKRLLRNSSVREVYAARCDGAETWNEEPWGSNNGRIYTLMEICEGTPTFP